MTLASISPSMAEIHAGAKHTAETRARNLFRYFGWQGGTIHQISAETGVSVTDLLYGEPDAVKRVEPGYSHGYLASDTCGLAMRLDLAKRKVVKGNADYWIGVACSRPVPGSE